MKERYRSETVVLRSATRSPQTSTARFASTCFVIQSPFGSRTVYLPFTPVLPDDKSAQVAVLVLTMPETVDFVNEWDTDQLYCIKLEGKLEEGKKQTYKLEVCK